MHALDVTRQLTYCFSLSDNEQRRRRSDLAAQTLCTATTRARIQREQGPRRWKVRGSSTPT
jgi:hypothetical protein